MRLSGPGAFAALKALAPGLTPRLRLAERAIFTDPRTGEPLDDGLALTFRAPASFTGEDVVELHVHGSPAVLDRLFAVLAEIGLRSARPGEFTRRAFASGKMDLTAAEGLADLIAADSEVQRVQALAQLGGAWGVVIADWQGRLLDLLALVEAGIDFVDEDDVPDGVTDSVPERLSAIGAEMAAHLDDGRRGEIIRDGLRVAIVGPPNVGKSTLLNALAGREVAIVSDMPGTTRDIIEVRLDLGGYVVVLSDTAGQRTSDDPIEREGVRRALALSAASDLRIFVTDSATRVGLETDDLRRPGDIEFANKADLGGAPPAVLPGLSTVWGAARTGAGIPDLLGILEARVRASAGGGGSLVTRARHRESLLEAEAAVTRAAIVGQALDLVAEDLRLALQALARIVGRFDVEQVLDRIFSSFCIGK